MPHVKSYYVYYQNCNAPFCKHVQNAECHKVKMYFLEHIYYINISAYIMDYYDIAITHRCFSHCLFDSNDLKFFNKTMHLNKGNKANIELFDIQGTVE